MQVMPPMSKKKPQTRVPKVPPAPVPPALEPTSEHREAILAIRCKPEFKDWAADFAKSERLTLTILVELGLLELAKKRGFKMPPER